MYPTTVIGVKRMIVDNGSGQPMEPDHGHRHPQAPSLTPAVVVILMPEVVRQRLVDPRSSSQEHEVPSRKTSRKTSHGPGKP
ncbi:MAG: hypothetical protein IPO59_13400 [Betaproteobacteria bacterium]|nr:hypothetical protein [Betaproteobacteria bacterium]